MKRSFHLTALRTIAIIVAMLFVTSGLRAQSCNIITTIAGNGSPGSSGDGGPATAAELQQPTGVAVDTAGNIYVADLPNYRVRKISPSGIISVFAGTGYGFSGDDGQATDAELGNPAGVALDRAGNVYIADRDNSRIRKVNTAGIISTFAGDGTFGFGGDGGQATDAQLNLPWNVATDNSGNVYIVDQLNQRIRKVSPDGIITTIAGSGSYGGGSGGFGGDGGPATSALLNYPYAVVVDPTGNIFIGDENNHRVRKVATTGIITTVAGTGATGATGDGGPATNAAVSGQGLTMDASGNLFISNGISVRKVNTSGIISTYAGGTSGFSGDGGPATDASFGSTMGIAIDRYGNLVIADLVNNRIREVTAGLFPVPTIAGPSSVATGATITLSDTAGSGTWSSSAASVATVSSAGVVTGVSGGTAIITYSVTNACGVAYTTHSVSVSGAVTSSGCGIITTIAGNGYGAGGATSGGSGGFTGDGGQATAAEINYPEQMAIDKYGNLYIADQINYRIRKVSTSGIITTIAGTGGRSGVWGDGGPATAAQFDLPISVAVDTNGNVYVADNSNSTVRKINTSGIISLFAGSYYSTGFSGDGGPATAAQLHAPWSIKTDLGGNVYLIDEFSNRVRKISTSGIINTIAGNGSGTISGDGGAATAAGIEPEAIAIDSSGNLYIGGGSKVRKVNSSGIINTVAGTGSYTSTGDGGPATAASFAYLFDITVDRTGNLYIADGVYYNVRKVNTAGIISTVAGLGYSAYSGDGGLASAAALSTPTGLAADNSGNLYIVDRGANRVRKVTFGPPYVAAISGTSSMCTGATTTF